MFKNVDRKIDKLLDYVEKGELYWEDNQYIEEINDRYTIIKWCGSYYFFPTIKQIDIDKLPRTNFEKYPRLSIYTLVENSQSIKCFGGGITGTYIISYGIKLGWHNEVDLDEIDLDNKVIKEMIWYEELNLWINLKCTKRDGIS